MAEELNYGNATHLLSCIHAFGKTEKHYTMRCHLLKEMSGDRVKIQVYGERYWANKEGVVRTRYVDKSRVKQIA